MKMLKERKNEFFLFALIVLFAVASEDVKFAVGLIFAGVLFIVLATTFRTFNAKEILMALFRGQAPNIINKENINNMYSDVVQNMIGNFKKIFTITIIGAILLIIIIKSIVVVSAGETGVYHLFGKVKDQELKSGLHLINPLASVTKMTTRTEQYTMSIVKEEGQRGGDDSIDALTNEGLTVTLDITVLYHLVEDMASDVYKNLGEGYEEKIIRPEVRSAIREAVARYDSKAIYTEKRDELINVVKQKLEQALNKRGIIVEGILLRNVSLPPKLASSIQEKLQAEQESQRYEFLLDKEKKEAQRKIIEAEGQRDAQKIINESLSDKYLNYLYIKELKDRQGTIYIPLNPETGMPIFKGVQ